MHEVARTADEIPQRQHNEDRMRRAKGWHERSEEATSDGERFIFLWIAFNAAYGSEASDSESLTQLPCFETPPAAAPQHEVSGCRTAVSQHAVKY